MIDGIQQIMDSTSILVMVGYMKLHDSLQVAFMMTLKGVVDNQMRDHTLQTICTYRNREILSSK